MQVSDIGIVDHARQRFRDHNKSGIYSGLSEEELEQRLKDIVLSRFHDPRWTQHILDDGVEAWAVRMHGAPMFGEEGLTAVVKGDDRNPGTHWVVVTFLTDEAVEKKHTLKHWQPFNKNIAVPRATNSGLAEVSKPLTQTLGDKLKSIAVEVKPVPTPRPLSQPPAQPASPTQTRLITFVLEGQAQHIELIATGVSARVQELIEGGADENSIRVWAPVKTKKVVTFVEE